MISTNGRRQRSIPIHVSAVAAGVRNSAGAIRPQNTPRGSLQRLCFPERHTPKCIPFATLLLYILSMLIQHWCVETHLTPEGVRKGWCHGPHIDTGVLLPMTNPQASARE